MRFEPIYRLKAKQPKLFRAVAWGGGVFLLFWALFGLYALYLNLNGNFHTVIAGELYRSAQPTQEDIALYKQRYNIQSIINLRGDNTGSGWYDEEVATARQLGITFVDFRMSARRELSVEQGKELARLLEESPKPVLVHCSRGADRSGFASALYLAVVAKKHADEAQRQISMRFGHVPIPYLSSAYAMDTTFDKMRPWLGDRADSR